ncbi:MAG: glycosyltransferase [Acidobacteria bacterium]|nr:glycosyltransferase [Acidobacteriota bacterium]
MSSAQPENFRRLKSNMQVPVSAVIPAFNGAAFIRETIGSVLAQTFQVDEIIVVDNNCTDGTIDIAKQLGARIVREPVQGVAAARNAGIKAARNEWIALLDHDDLWHPRRIELQWKGLRTRPDIKYVGSAWKVVDAAAPSSKEQILAMFPDQGDVDEGDLILIRPDASTQAALPFAHPSTQLIHKEVFEEVGLFDERFSGSDDIEFVLRALARYTMLYLKSHLAVYRIHGENTLIRQAARVSDARWLVLNELCLSPHRYHTSMAKHQVEFAKQEFANRGRSLSHQGRGR